VIKILYKKIRLDLVFPRRVAFTTPPAFVMRSVLGFRLRELCCVAPRPREAACGTCLFHDSCVYGTVFESVLAPGNAALPGRDRASHPFALEAAVLPGDGPTRLDLGLALMGPAIAALPYLYAAIRRGGEGGLLRERVPYRVTGVRDGEESILVDEDTIDTSRPSSLWEWRPGGPRTGSVDDDGGDGDEDAVHKEYLVRAVSPLRFKAAGRYTHRFDAAAFAGCLHRRAQTLTTLYGVNDTDGNYVFSGAWSVTANRLAWRDAVHYSGRQRTAMRLGGALGEFEIAGRFTAYERALLSFAEIFHAGKHANFGLGQVRVWEREGRGSG